NSRPTGCAAVSQFLDSREAFLKDATAMCRAHRYSPAPSGAGFPSFIHAWFNTGKLAATGVLGRSDDNASQIRWASLSESASTTRRRSCAGMRDIASRATPGLEHAAVRIFAVVERYSSP